MMKYFKYLIVILISSNVFGQNDESLAKHADSLYKAGEYEECSKIYESYFKATEQEVDADQYYDAAVSFSKIGNPNGATHWLQKSIDRGGDDVYLTSTRFDLNFYAIGHTAQWRDFIESNTSKFDIAANDIAHPQLRTELLGLWQSDQYYRQLIFGRYNGRPPNEVAGATEAVDRYNAMRLEEIMDEIGWPSYSKVGRDGAHAAWNIIQHAVFNPPLMKRALLLMEEAITLKEVDGVDYANLYDRYNAVSYLGKQDYGIVRGVPIRDEHLVEERRRAKGFTDSLKDYLGSYTPMSQEECKKREKELLKKYRTNLEHGNMELENENYEEASKYYKEVMRCNGYIQTEDIYKMAQIHGQLNTRRSKFQTVRYIRSLSARGFNDIERLNSDTAFDEIRTQDTFLEVMRVIKKYNVDTRDN